MSGKIKAGGKIAGKHTSAIPATEIIINILGGLSEVYKISLGIIKGGLRVKGENSKRVKAIQEKEKVIKLSIRDNCSCQEIRVFTTDSRTTKEELAQKIEKQKNFSISFRKSN